MKFPGRVEPHQIPLFPSSARASIAIHVRLHPPWLPLYVSKEFKIQLVVCLLKQVSIRSLQQIREKKKPHLHITNSPFLMLLVVHIHTSSYSKYPSFPFFNFFLRNLEEKEYPFLLSFMFLLGRKTVWRDSSGKVDRFLRKVRPK